MGTHSEWSYNAVIYEVNIRQYTQEGTFIAFEREMFRLRALGVDILWLMPIFPIGKPNRKGTLGSYYSIADYRGINPEFGDLEGLRRIIKKAHAFGMRVILDWVANHTAWDNVWLTEDHTDWYEQDENGNVVSPFDWSDTAKLNYSNRDMRRAMIDAMKYWITAVNIDGFREDMAGLVPLDFWQEAAAELRKAKSDIFMLGEVEAPEYHPTFDATYAWEYGHFTERLAKGEENVDGLRGFINWDNARFPKDALRLRFTSNHDENSWSGSEFERLGDAARAFAALSYVLPGIPLMYSGQEAGESRRIEFFEKDCINWSGLSEWSKFYRELNTLRHRCDALSSGERGADMQHINTTQDYNVFAFKRKSADNTVIAIFNLTPWAIEPAFRDEDYSGDYEQLGGSTVTLREGEYTPYGAWEFKIYFR